MQAKIGYNNKNNQKPTRPLAPPVLGLAPVPVGPMSACEAKRGFPLAEGLLPRSPARGLSII